MEKLTSVSIQESAENFSNVDLAFSALEDDLQKVIVENNLGCDIFIKTVEQISETVDVLQNNTQMTLLMPPPTFSDRLNTVSKSREIRYYVAIEIIESKVVCWVLSSYVYQFQFPKSCTLSFFSAGIAFVG